MPDYESFGETLKTFFVSATRIFLYPPLLVLRVLARLLLLAATVLPVAVPFLAGNTLLDFWEELGLATKIASFVEKDETLFTGLTYFVAVGLFANYLKTVVSMFWEAVKGVLRPIRDVFLGEWIPSAVVRQSLAGTWRDNIVEIPRNLTLAAGRTALLTAAVAAGAVVVAVTMPLVLRDTKVDRYVWVATAEPKGDLAGQPPGGQNETDARKADTGQEEDRQPVAEPPDTRTPPPTRTQPVLEAHLRNGTVFSLTHLQDAQLHGGKEGICLNELQQAWLGEFRDAIAECVKIEGRDRGGAGVRQFDVKAFASVAPVKSTGLTSEELNCEIANRRADAVGAFLAKGDESKWHCESEPVPFGAHDNPCAAGAGAEPFEDYTGTHNGAKFKVRVHWWRSPGEMEGRKPADDGALPGDRRYGTEMFNRSVHITVPRDFCRPSKPEQSEVESAADATAGAEVPAESSNEQE